MIRLKFSPLAVLPDAALVGLGPVSQAFEDRGLTTFHQALTFLAQAPYGPNTQPYVASSFWDDGQGTCLTKHGLAALLAEELGLPVSRYEGFYPLDDSIVTGVGPILAEAGLAFVPRTHCFLGHGRHWVDLTEGNCTGKNGLIEEYLRVFPVAAEMSADRVDEINRDYYTELCASDPLFARHGVDGLLALLRRCSAVNTARCLVQRQS